MVKPALLVRGWCKVMDYQKHQADKYDEFAPYQLQTELLSDFPHHVVCNRVQLEKHDMENIDMMDTFTPIPTTSW